MKETTHANELPLSVTYRSRQVIVEFVNKEISGSVMIAHKEGGEVTTIQKETVTQQIIEHDVRMIVGAKNKSLIECWILLAKSKIASSLKGSRIVQELRDIIADIDPRDLNDLLMKIQEAVEGAIIVDADGEAHYNLPQQKIDLMDAVPELVESFNMTTLRDFENLLREMEQDANREIHTVHSAKGLEAEAVIVLCDWFPSDQLLNMQYVAYTRAESKLLLVADWQNKKECEL
jgi:superfamily I DNA/RNA helicase